MDYKFKIGDKVIMDKIKILSLVKKYDSTTGIVTNIGHLPDWYTDETYTIIKYVDNNTQVVVLDRELPYTFDRISICYIKLTLIGERREKLLKIMKKK